MSSPYRKGLKIDELLSSEIIQVNQQLSLSIDDDNQEILITDENNNSSNSNNNSNTNSPSFKLPTQLTSKLATGATPTVASSSSSIYKNNNNYNYYDNNAYFTNINELNDDEYIESLQYQYNATSGDDSNSNNNDNNIDYTILHPYIQHRQYISNISPLAAPPAMSLWASGNGGDGYGMYQQQLPITNSSSSNGGIGGGNVPIQANPNLQQWYTSLQQQQQQQLPSNPTTNPHTTTTTISNKPPINFGLKSLLKGTLKIFPAVMRLDSEGKRLVQERKNRDMKKKEEENMRQIKRLKELSDLQLQRYQQQQHRREVRLKEYNMMMEKIKYQRKCDRDLGYPHSSEDEQSLSPYYSDDIDIHPNTTTINNTVIETNHINPLQPLKKIKKMIMLPLPLGLRVDENGRKFRKETAMKERQLLRDRRQRQRQRDIRYHTKLQSHHHKKKSLLMKRRQELEDRKLARLERRKIKASKSGGSGTAIGDGGGGDDTIIDDENIPPPPLEEPPTPPTSNPDPNPTTTTIVSPTPTITTTAILDNISTDEENDKIEAILLQPHLNSITTTTTTTTSTNNVDSISDSNIDFGHNKNTHGSDSISLGIILGDELSDTPSRSDDSLHSPPTTLHYLYNTVTSILPASMRSDPDGIRIHRERCKQQKQQYKDTIRKSTITNKENLIKKIQKENKRYKLSQLKKMKSVLLMKKKSLVLSSSNTGGGNGNDNNDTNSNIIINDITSSSGGGGVNDIKDLNELIEKEQVLQQQMMLLDAQGK